MTTLNLDYETRNELIFGNNSDVDWLGGIKHFDNLMVDQLNELIVDNYIDVNECQNSSPSVGEFFEFMKKHRQVAAHGYAVSHKRDDYRVSIEGLSYCGNLSKDLLFDFIHLCRHADEFIAEEKRLYSWWD